MARRRSKKLQPEKSQKHGVHHEIAGILILVISLLIFIGNSQAASSSGLIGQWIFRGLFRVLIGDGRFVLPGFLLVAGFLILFGKQYTRPRTRNTGFVLAFFSYIMFLELQSGRVGDIFLLGKWTTHAGGIFGYFLSFLFKKFIGFMGLKILLIAGMLISLLMIFRITLLDSLRFMVQSIDFVFDWFASFSAHEEEEEPAAARVAAPVQPQQRSTPVTPSPIEKQAAIKQESVKDEPVKDEIEPVEVSMPALDMFRAKPLSALEEDFELPDLNLLQEVKGLNKDQVRKMEDEMKATIQKLEETLESFKVSARVVNTSQGPTVTRYEIQPGFGVKVSKIVNLADDIALNLAAKGVRIEAPVPGKSVVGIEIPNKTTQIVNLLPLARDEKFLNSSSPLLVIMGKDLDDKTAYLDITKMPHLLVAGATGSGKSVCINSIILSLLLRNTPSTVRFIMIDPKKVELSVYDDIPHLIAPVVTDPKKAAVTLRWCVREMEKRYEELAGMGVRNIEGYNNKIIEMMQKKDAMTAEEQTTFFVPRKLEYIVVIIDELADLMLAAASEVETSIARVAQMARAVGIHLIIATQRPSVDVITGLIKANVPSRISFAVSSQIDSRTILDGMGAEKLLGRGDMLFKPVGSMQPIRMQGVYISDKEVHDIVNFVKSQGQPQYLQEVVNLRPEDLEDLKSSGSSSSEDADEFYEEARDLIIQSKVASISYIQRKLRIGYNRAARIMEELEANGVVSSPDGDGKNRKVII
jgi:S-DNA-T family DNA segregation ATPase FtsK/SpoIIIE